ncbi:unnamed protein product [Caretta caretta]
MMALPVHHGSRLLSIHLFWRTVSRGSRLLHSQPPEENVGLVETVIGLSAFSLAVLGPAGWFLFHLPSYKKK